MLVAIHHRLEKFTKCNCFFRIVLFSFEQAFFSSLYTHTLSCNSFVRENMQETKLKINLTIFFQNSIDIAIISLF